jgi:hypothetical protein
MERGETVKVAKSDKSNETTAKFLEERAKDIRAGTFTGVICIATATDDKVRLCLAEVDCNLSQSLRCYSVIADTYTTLIREDIDGAVHAYELCNELEKAILCSREGDDYDNDAEESKKGRKRRA